MKSITDGLEANGACRRARCSLRGVRPGDGEEGNRRRQRPRPRRSHLDSSINIRVNRALDVSTVALGPRRRKIAWSWLAGAGGSQSIRGLSCAGSCGSSCVVAVKSGERGVPEATRGGAGGGLLPDLRLPSEMRSGAGRVKMPAAATHRRSPAALGFGAFDPGTCRRRRRRAPADASAPFKARWTRRAFPRRSPLRDILRNDARHPPFRHGRNHRAATATTARPRS
jgi:hypothetical protein